MTEEKLSYDDVKEYESLFTMAPSFVLNAMVKRNTNLVKKFQPSIVKYLKNLTPVEKEKLNHILNADTESLQKLMFVSYKKTGKKQYYILANPENREFVRMNLDELKQLVEF